MRVIKFDRTQDIPVIDATVSGPLGKRKVRLVFDTGCGLTQIDTCLIENIGYSATDGDYQVEIRGAAGAPLAGYRLRVAALSFFGLKFEGVKVAALDFDFLGSHRIDGLLGFDLIKQLHLEMDGPKGELSIFSAARE